MRILKRVLAEILRRILKLVLNVLFRVRVIGIENYHKAGGRLLIVANHVSFLDGILLAIYLPKMPRFVINTYMAQNWWVKPFLWLIDYVTIDPINPLYVKTLIRTIEHDGPIVIFPEGRITVTGSLMKIYQGPGLVADKTGANILPVHLDGPEYSMFSRLAGVVRRRLFPKIRISILPPRTIDVPHNIKGPERREKAGHIMQDIMRDTVFSGKEYELTLFEALLEARDVHGGGHQILEDVNRRIISYNVLVRAAFALAKGLRRPLDSQQVVGLMLPNAIPMVASFLSLHLLGKTPAMINYTAGSHAIRSAINTARLSTVITSRKFVEMAGLHELVTGISDLVNVLYLEDIKESLTSSDKLSAMISSWFPWMAWRSSRATRDTNETAVILFTSGSEGEPKGVVLSHANLLSNCVQLKSVINFSSYDVMLNAMPLFHSFGLLAGMVLPITSGIRCFLYPSPLHYSVIPELSYDIRATILFGTNTFLAGYARKAHSYDFDSVRLAIAGAERLQDDTRMTWFDKFGIRILEGYGATETSPVVSINTPFYYKAGTVGRLLPTIDYYLQPVPGISHGGRLVVKGPNIMRGYIMPDDPGVLKPPRTDRGPGWYDTGDIVTVDELLFVTIQGRAKRFAKIAGEMVSLAQVEQMAKTCWPEDMHAVVSIADAKKGEQLVLLTTINEPQRRELQHTARDMGLSELLVPRLIHEVKEIPLLGTGKIDYSCISEMVAEIYSHTQHD